MKLFKRLILLGVFSTCFISAFLFIKAYHPFLISRSDVLHISSVFDENLKIMPNSNHERFVLTSDRSKRSPEKTGSRTQHEHAANIARPKRLGVLNATSKKATRLPQRKPGEAMEAVGRSPDIVSLATAANTTINNNNNSDKWVVFICDNRRSCGGWGDRQRGLTGVYLLALVTGRRFALVLTRPCPITHHYVPNLVPWDVPPETLTVAGRDSNITLDDVNSRQRLTARLRIMDFNAMFPQRVVYIRTNGEYWLGLRASKLYKPVLPDWARKSRPQYFAAAWTRLMKPSPSLQAAFDAFLDRIHFRQRTRPLVCAHVRVGRSATFKRDASIRYDTNKLPVLWNFLQRWVDNGSHIFLATDDYEVRNRTRHHFGAWMLDTGEKIVHVDQNRKRADVCHGFQSALLDQLILSRCDVLVTSHSIFSQRASYLRGRSDNLYTILRGAVVRNVL